MPGLAPLDAELNLPPERASLELRRRVARFAAKMSFNDVVDDIRAITETELTKRQVEELAVPSARDFEAFYEARRLDALASAAPSDGEVDDDDSILVVTTDGKGIPMLSRQPPRSDPEGRGAERAEAPEASFEGREGPQETYGGGGRRILDTSSPRAPEDVVARLRPAPERPAAKRPDPQDKRVWASVKAPAEGVIDEVFEEGSRTPSRSPSALGGPRRRQ